MVRHRKPPSQTWRTFLDNHVKIMVSVDFFTVPTIRFQVLYVFLVLAHAAAGFSTLPLPPIPLRSGRPRNLGKPLGHRAPLFAAGSRPDLRERIRGPNQSHGDQPGAVGTTFPQATGICRTRHRHHPPRVPGPRHRVRRMERVPSPATFRGLPSSEPDAPGIGEGHAGTSPDPTRRHGAGCFHAGSRRTASSLRAPRRIKASLARFHPLWPGPCTGLLKVTGAAPVKRGSRLCQPTTRGE